MSPWEGCLQEEPKLWDEVLAAVAAKPTGPLDEQQTWAPCRLVCRSWAEACGLERLTHLQVSPSKLPQVNWQALPNLTSLKLWPRFWGGPDSLTDDMLRLLVPTLEALPALNSLEISYNSLLSDDGIRHLRGLTRLRYLHLGHLHHVTDEGLAELADMADLQQLFLWTCSVTDAGMRSLVSNHPGLTELELEMNPFVTDDGLLALGALTALKSLFFSNLGKLTTPVTHKGLLMLSRLASLTRLEMYGSSFREAYEHITVGTSPRPGCLTGCLPALESLSAEKDGFLLLMDMCPTLTTLTYLEMTSPATTYHREGDLWTKLQAQAGLVDLRVTVTDPDCMEVLLALSKLSQLRALKLDLYESFPPKDLVQGALEGLTGLTTLDLSGSDLIVTDEMLTCLPRLARLAHLNITECPEVTREGVASLMADMPSLGLCWDGDDTSKDEQP